MTKAGAGEFSVFVPARLRASRLPNKPLADIGGAPMLAHVLRRAEASGAARVVAAVDDDALARAAQDAGFTAVKTGEHDSGGARIAEAAKILALPDDAVIVNVQGDEPFIEPDLIARVAALLLARADCVCSTACRPPRDSEEYADAAAVKVVCAKDGAALYFSRAAVPHAVGTGAPAADASAEARIHIGVYAYRIGALRRFLSLPPAPAERIERLEQLRILWHGGRIAVLDADSDSFGVDTPADLARARAVAAKHA